MNGRCGICGSVLGTSDINGICQTCLNQRSSFKETARYQTYQNGFKDGYAAGISTLDSIRKNFEKAISCVQIRYIVVTQEKYDELLSNEVKE